MNQEALRTAILDSLREIAPQADYGRLGDADDIRDSLDLDSMDILNFVIALHARTGIDVPERDYSKLGTMAKALAYLSAPAGGSG
ncbi:MAG: acyl carrier protein [Chloroflexi bacterium]|nr:acyl carrier protein [Chloroflexota bacterium]